MGYGTLVVGAQRSRWGRGFDLYMFRPRADSRTVDLVTNVEFKETKDGDPLEGPSACMEDATAQRLMDDLWQAGIRPTQAQNHDAAQAAHLADLRKLVFEHYVPLEHRRRR